MREAINLIWKLSVLAQLTAAARLTLQGLAGEYPALLTACCVLPLKSILLMAAYSSPGSHIQIQQIARQLDPIEWAVSAWIVVELLSLWSGNTPGVRRQGRVLLAGFLAVAALISLACWRVEWRTLGFTPEFRVHYILDRVVWGTLALFVSGIWLFFRDYPMPVAPNIVKYTQIAAIYFLVGSLCLLTFTLSGLAMVGAVNLVIVMNTAFCFGACAALLTRKGRSRAYSR